VGSLLIDAERHFAAGRAVWCAIEVPLDEPSVTVLFGPSGSGKTTALRMIAGLERPDAGRVVCGDVVWSDAGAGTWRSPRDRRVGFLHQDGALFPHLTVAGNVGYGLRRVPAAARRTRVADLLARTGLAELADRRPGQLSGGQRQRVALARTLAVQPTLILLDEPLSALDAPTREVLRTELRDVLAGAGVPSLLVTHDRTEALALGDRLAVMIDGRVRQVGPVAEVFGRPASAEVAEAVGTETVVPCRVRQRTGGTFRLAIDGGGELVASAEVTATLGDHVLACIRAEDVLLRTGVDTRDSARNHLHARVTGLRPGGALIRVDLDCGFPLTSIVTPAAREDLEIEVGSHVTAVVKASAIHCVPRPEPVAAGTLGG
jgi:molybdate transport system ATP-binding protein